jgi:hypothetical protein
VQERGGQTISVGGVLASVVCHPSVMHLPAKRPYTLPQSAAK